VKQLKRYLEKNMGQEGIDEEVTMKHVVDSLNEVLERSSTRTRNNTGVALSTIFQTLAELRD